VIIPKLSNGAAFFMGLLYEFSGCKFINKKKPALIGLGFWIGFSIIFNLYISLISICEMGSAGWRRTTLSLPFAFASYSAASALSRISDMESDSVPAH